MVLPIIVNFTCKQDIRDELDYSGIVCTDLRTIGMDRERKNLSCVLARTYDQGSNRGVLLYTSRTTDREWSSRERSLLKSLTPASFHSYLQNVHGGRAAQLPEQA